MINYMRGEFYRIRHKKSACIGLAVAVLMGLTPASVDVVLAWIFPVVVGTFLFTTVYTDDLASKKLPTLIGFGLSRVKIFLSKVVIMAILAAGVFAVAAAVRCLVGVIWSDSDLAAGVVEVFLCGLLGFLYVFAYSTFSSIVVYGAQKAIPAVAAYVLLSTSLVSQIIAASAPITSKYLVYNIGADIIRVIGLGAIPTTEVAKYIAYVAICAVLAVFAFTMKELEF